MPATFPSNSKRLFFLNFENNPTQLTFAGNCVSHICSTGNFCHSSSRAVEQSGINRGRKNPLFFGARKQRCCVKPSVHGETSEHTGTAARRNFSNFVRSFSVSFPFYSRLFPFLPALAICFLRPAVFATVKMAIPS